MSVFDYDEISDIAFKIFNESFSLIEEAKSDETKEKRKAVKRIAKTADNTEDVKSYVKDEVGSVEDEVAKVVDSVPNRAKGNVRRKGKKPSIEDVTPVSSSEKESPESLEQAVDKAQGVEKKEEKEDIKETSDLAINQLNAFKNAFKAAKAKYGTDRNKIKAEMTDKFLLSGQALINKLVNIVNVSDDLLYKVDEGADSARGIFPAITYSEAKKQTQYVSDKGTRKITDDKSKAYVRFPNEGRKDKKGNPKEISKITFSPSKSYTITADNTLFAIKLTEFSNNALMIKMLPGSDYDFLLIMGADELTRQDIDPLEYYKGLAYYQAFDFLVQNF